MSGKEIEGDDGAADGLLPARPPIADAEGEPRLVDVGDADAFFDALSSSTSRAVFTSLYAEPGTASDVAARVDTSLQNAQYHLSKLMDLGLVSVVGTWYSSKGVEMDVYAPANEPLVVVVGDAEDASGCRDAVAEVAAAD